MHKKVVRWD